MVFVKTLSNIDFRLDAIGIQHGFIAKRSLRKVQEGIHTNHAISLVREAVSNAWTYREACLQIHASGRFDEHDFRLDAHISDIRSKLPRIDRSTIETSLARLARSLDRSRNLDGVNAIKISDLTRNNTKILNALPQDLSSASLGYLAIAFEDTALFLSSIDLPRCQRDALAAMTDAATLADTAVLAERHSRWDGRASMIACQIGQNLRLVSNNLWRNHIIESTDPRLKINFQQLKAEPLYEAGANRFLDEGRRILNSMVPKLRTLPDTNFSASAVKSDLIEVQSYADRLRRKKAGVGNAERSTIQANIMRKISSAAERSALSMEHAGSSENVDLLFAISCTAARRSYLYDQKARQSPTRKAGVPNLH